MALYVCLLHDSGGYNSSPGDTGFFAPGGSWDTGELTKLFILRNCMQLRPADHHSAEAGVACCGLRLARLLAVVLMVGNCGWMCVRVVRGGCS